MTIRRYRRDDAEALWQAARESTVEMLPWMPWCHPAYAAEETHGWLQHCDAAWDGGYEYNFAIVDGDDRFLGGCGLNRFDHQHRTADLGYWVRTSATRRGVATAAVRQLADFAFRDADLLRVEIVIAVGNVASQRVAAKVGALREGVAHDRLYLHGISHDAVVYALLRSRRPDPIARRN